MGRARLGRAHRRVLRRPRSVAVGVGVVRGEGEQDGYILRAGAPRALVRSWFLSPYSLTPDFYRL